MEIESFISSLEPMVPFTRAIGTLLCAFVTLFVIAKFLHGRPFNAVATAMQFVTGVFLIMPTQILTAVVSLPRTLSNFLNRLAGGTGIAPSTEPEQSPPPVETPVESSPGMDLSWVPGLLTVSAIALAAVAAGAGLIYFYRKAIRPSFLKSRSEARTAATMIEEARKTLKWVTLDSASYETDLGKQIDYPLMTDVSEHLVAKYVREMRQAQEREVALPKKPLLSEAQSFSNAVHDLKLSYEAAVRKAERVRWSNFSVAEQRRLKDAQVALTIVQDSSTTPEQRNAQYKRIAKLLDGLIVLTEPTKMALGAWVPMLAIEGGSGIAETNSLGVKVPVAV